MIFCCLKFFLKLSSIREYEEKQEKSRSQERHLDTKNANRIVFNHSEKAKDIIECLILTSRGTLRQKHIEALARIRGFLCLR